MIVRQIETGGVENMIFGFYNRERQNQLRCYRAPEETMEEQINGTR